MMLARALVLLCCLLMTAHAKDRAAPVVRISRGSFAAADLAKVKARLADSERALAPELKKLRGLRHYWVAIDPVSNTIVNVSVWDSLTDAKQMDGLRAMQELAKDFVSMGVKFERPILNYETLWEIPST